ncbi:hypothetical protein [Mycobacterium parmense]|uniref:Anti-sigma-M factor RsmA n=1 Tax=Mycobacterium parmense TaxID=185642 RepID=A0A7I7YZ50_9MYCO|nr:hypothetical protein [Mycobacterium parmense]MCV7349871.1 hypothetical protein [Mycobacterium parmense]ORW59991.1 hypothetical protein AWC20_09405 [Mycobacterium parmense]BBZ46602.1 anti-sigma-M factor RsmA [Mycobacterium parmense]
MNAVGDDADGHHPDQGAAGADPALTVEQLADLQAGLLDDDAAARVRRRVRDDPHAQGVLAALNQVRRDVAALGVDAASAPEPPAPVVEEISAALRSAGARPRGGAVHSARPHVRPVRLVAAVTGSCALLAAIGFGTAALLRAPQPAPSAPVTAEHITVSTPPMAVPLSPAEIVALTRHDPDYGPLHDPSRRASCLSGLGYPASAQVLGARPVAVNARPGVLLVLPGDTPQNLAVFVVSLNCNAADTGLLASTGIPRP